MEWLFTYIIAPLFVAVVAAVLLRLNWRRIRRWFADRVNWRRIRRWFAERGKPPEPGTHFTALIAELEDDTDGKQTRHVERALASQRSIGVRCFPKVLRAADHGDTADNLAAAEQKGRVWLAGHNADILIWGEVAKPDHVLRLRFLSVSGTSGAVPRSYALTEALELPESFGDDFAGVLYAVALSSIAPATEREGQYLVDLLKPATGKIERLLANPPPSLKGRGLAVVQGSFATAAAVLGEQSGEAEWLNKAVAAHRSALAEFTREKHPEDWAATQNNLGAALQTLGEREEGTVRLEEAVSAFRAALEVRTRDRLPLDWATTQNNLGAALARLGEREEGTARLEEAVSAFRAALEVYEAARASYYAGGVRRNLERAERLIVERRRR